MADRPSGSLLRRLLLATLGPTVLALVAFGLLADQVARRLLEDELGKRLQVAAVSIASGVLREQFQVSDESSNAYRNGLERLRRARDRLGVRRVLLVAPDLAARGDTDGRVALGASAHELGADRAEMDRAARRKPATSLLFTGLDGLPYKRGYAAAGDAAAPSGFVVVEARADFFDSLAAFRRWLLLAGSLALAVIVGVTVIVARRITGPLARLAAAAERIGRGDLRAPVPIETRDEIGLLAATLDEMRAALRARDERMQMMLAGIAHEVRNPLGGVALYAGLLREALAAEPERLAEVARIEREVGHLKAVVSDFLEYARRPAPEMTDVPLRAVLDEVRELAVPAGGGLAVAVAVEAPTDLTVRGDRTQIRRALLNLARNAAAVAKSRVVLAARLDGTRVAVEVADDGPGVALAERDRIFTPFFTTREKGTGLGLAFVREIVRDHGGEVAVDDAPGGGARFRFTLPGVSG